MLKYNSKKDQNTQSKSNLVELFRKRIESKSGKNTPVHPSCIKPSTNLSALNYQRQRQTPSKTSVFSLDEVSEIQLANDGYFNYSKQQLGCHIHNNKAAKFIREGTEESYCEKCAIVLTNQGFRLIQIDGTAKVKKFLETVMKKQVEAIQQSYAKTIELLSRQMQKDINSLINHYQTIQNSELNNRKIQIQIYSPTLQLQKLTDRIKSSIGKLSYKVINTDMIINPDQYKQPRQSCRRSQKSHGRDSQKSNKRKAPPVQIMINLYMDDPYSKQNNKQNREINLLT